jgi:hypothetical protein
MEPEAKSKALNDLLQKEIEGKLSDFVYEAAKKWKPFDFITSPIPRIVT